jgi:hypothetical protein
MNELILLNGGRPFYNEDLETLQETLFTLEKSFGSFQSQGFVLSGCEIFANNPTENQISEGLVCIGGKMLKLDNAVYSTISPHFIIADVPQDTDTRTYENGNSQNSTRIYKAIISPTNNNGIALPNNSNTQLKNIWQILENKGEKIGSIKLVSKNTFLNFFDENTGLGSGEWEGWAWADGRNNTDDTAGFFIYGYKLGDDLDDTGGQTEVILSEAQTPLPSHTHDSISIGSFTQNSQNAPYLQGTTSPAWRAFDVSDVRTTQSSDNRMIIEAHNNLPPYIKRPYIQKIS